MERDRVHWVFRVDVECDGPHGAEKITRFGGYCTHELDLSPEAYEPHFDVGFTKLGPENEER
ncbi:MULTISPECIES: hypothetical protein [unclassified Streptomyces]|uniref:hypothetical protein n=1 Tax=unclassified Streptomyces TaxID=2593676 RepID=UPI002E2BD004|nr:hypothetical protein [Streptomyces sp. NBC_00273]